MPRAISIESAEQVECTPPHTPQARELMNAAANTSAVIVRAAHHGQHGHPVLFKRAVFDEIYRGQAAAKARS